MYEHRPYCGEHTRADEEEIQTVVQAATQVDQASIEPSEKF